MNFSGGIGARYAAGGYERTYGFPVFAETAITGGAMQKFRTISGGYTAFYWTPAHHRTHTVWENGAIGGGVTQIFRTSTGAETVYTWSPSAGTHTVNGRGAIYAHWRNTGFTSVYGYPTSDEAYIGNGVYAVKFSSGKTINWSSARGIWVS